MSHFGGEINNHSSAFVVEKIESRYGTVIATYKFGAEMEVAGEVKMSSRMTLRKAVLEVMKQSGSNSTVESPKQPDRNSEDLRKEK
jgi:hypothetical protein